MRELAQCPNAWIVRRLEVVDRWTLHDDVSFRPLVRHTVRVSGTSSKPRIAGISRASECYARCLVLPSLPLTTWRVACR